MKPPAFDLARFSKLPSLDALRAKLPRMPAFGDLPSLGGNGLPPALHDMLGRLSELKPAAPLCGMGARGGAAPEVAVPEGARFTEFTHQGAAGALGYRLYVPSRSNAEAMPLVVMLHGCTQSPEDFAAGTRMNDLAEEQGFLVVYPRQTQSANAQKCWNWFDAAGQLRDRGEPALIAGLTRDVMRDFSVDPSRVYVAGLSAGGAAAAILAQCYPDLFAAAGRPFRARRRRRPRHAGRLRGHAGRRAGRRGTRGPDHRVPRRRRPHRASVERRAGDRPGAGRGGAECRGDAGALPGRARLHPPGGERRGRPADGGALAAARAPATPGRAAAPPVPTRSRAAPTPAARCCGSFCSTGSRLPEPSGLLPLAAVRDPGCGGSNPSGSTKPMSEMGGQRSGRFGARRTP